MVLVLLFLAELFYFRIADRCNIIDKPNERSSHTKVTLRGGGIIFYFGAVSYTHLKIASMAKKAVWVNETTYIYKVHKGSITTHK